MISWRESDALKYQATQVLHQAVGATLFETLHVTKRLPSIPKVPYQNEQHRIV